MQAHKTEKRRNKTRYTGLLHGKTEYRTDAITRLPCSFYGLTIKTFTRYYRIIGRPRYKTTPSASLYTSECWPAGANPKEYENEIRCHECTFAKFQENNMSNNNNYYTIDTMHMNIQIISEKHIAQ